ncbi:MAG: hypothetical protein ACP5RT_00995, partial [Candidatus Micrarchaeia archaeon]
MMNKVKTQAVPEELALLQKEITNKLKLFEGITSSKDKFEKFFEQHGKNEEEQRNNFNASWVTLYYLAKKLGVDNELLTKINNQIGERGKELNYEIEKYETEKLNGKTYSAIKEIIKQDFGCYPFLPNVNGAPNFYDSINTAINNAINIPTTEIHDSLNTLLLSSEAQQQPTVLKQDQEYQTPSAQSQTPQPENKEDTSQQGEDTQSENKGDTTKLGKIKNAFKDFFSAFIDAVSSEQKQNKLVDKIAEQSKSKQLVSQENKNDKEKYSSII